MSQSTKRKHVTKEVLDEFELPKDNQKIVRVVAGRGNNLHQVCFDSYHTEEAKNEVFVLKNRLSL